MSEDRNKVGFLHLLLDVGGRHCLHLASTNMGSHLAGVPFARKRSFGALSIFSSAQKASRGTRMLDGLMFVLMFLLAFRPAKRATS